MAVTSSSGAFSCLYPLSKLRKFINIAELFHELTILASKVISELNESARTKC